MKLIACVLLFLSHYSNGFSQTYNEEIHYRFFKDNPYNKQQLALASKNALSILVMWHKNQILINGEPADKSEIKQRVKIFITNTKQEVCLPMSANAAFVVVSYDIDADFAFFESVYKEIMAAYHEVRNEVAMSRYNTAYVSLNKPKKRRIDKLYPIKLVDGRAAIVKYLPNNIDCYYSK
jgi:hypothetical protein